MKKSQTVLAHFEKDRPFEPGYPDLLNLQTKRRKRLNQIWMTGIGLLVFLGTYVVTYLIFN